MPAIARFTRAGGKQRRPSAESEPPALTTSFITASGASDMPISSRIEKAAVLSASHSLSVIGVKRPPDVFPIIKEEDCLSSAISVADKRERRPRRTRGMGFEALSVIE